jgi:hypothetical protein
LPVGLKPDYDGLDFANPDSLARSPAFFTVDDPECVLFEVDVDRFLLSMQPDFAFDNVDGFGRAYDSKIWADPSEFDFPNLFFHRFPPVEVKRREGL